jgi:hypothetical protein
MSFDAVQGPTTLQNQQNCQGSALSQRELCSLSSALRHHRRRRIWYYATSLRLRWECHIQNLLEQLWDLAQFLSKSNAIWLVSNQFEVLINLGGTLPAKFEFCAEFDFLQNSTIATSGNRLGGPPMITPRFHFYAPSPLLVRANYLDRTLVLVARTKCPQGTHAQDTQVVRTLCCRRHARSIRALQKERTGSNAAHDLYVGQG